MQESSESVIDESVSSEKEDGGMQENVSQSVKDTTSEVIAVIGEDSSKSSGDDIARTNIMHYKSYNLLHMAIRDHEIQTRMSYVRTYNRTQGFDHNNKFEHDFNLNSYLLSIDDVKKIRFHWKLKLKDTTTFIPDTGVPFILLSSIVYSCHKGKDRMKKQNDQRREKKMQELYGRGNIQEHSHPKTRKRNQPSKKSGCPAKFDVKKCVFFPQYSVVSKVTERKQREATMKLRQDLNNLRTKLRNSGGGGGADVINVHVEENTEEIQVDVPSIVGGANVNVLHHTSVSQSHHHHCSCSYQ